MVARGIIQGRRNVSSGQWGRRDTPPNDCVGCVWIARKAWQKTFLLPVLLTLLLPLVGASPLNGESTRSLIESGNKAYEKEDYVEAEIDYRKALEKEADLVEGSFNLGGALYKQGKYDVSVEALEKVISASEPDDMKAKALFNRGNALFKRQMYPESVESYIQSLRLHPDDMAAKYNLTYALMKLREEMKQSSQPSQTDREEEEKGDKQGDPLGHQEENASGENPPPVERDEKASDEASKGDSIPRPEEHQISRSEAERILEALRNNEMEVQKKLRERSTAGIRVEKDW